MKVKASLAMRKGLMFELNLFMRNLVEIKIVKRQGDFKFIHQDKRGFESCWNFSQSDVKRGYERIKKQ